ncbi:hypothetical protein M6B38_390895 [Iris pallida]|uniref:Uncharacterized protein n=1 Tax=Iris pallida TaxID=29817 RepID=A0AAX6FZ58_IRIPA|nr:hypothetical protein M6B38_390895 [Iris pallida]
MSRRTSPEFVDPSSTTRKSSTTARSRLELLCPRREYTRVPHHHLLELRVEPAFVRSQATTGELEPPPTVPELLGPLCSIQIAAV